MSRILRILERARIDVDVIFDWLVHRSVRGAISWYLAFGRAARKIADSPESFAEAPESGPLGYPLRHAFFKTRRGRSTGLFSSTPIPGSSFCESVALVNRH